MSQVAPFSTRFFLHDDAEAGLHVIHAQVDTNDEQSYVSGSLLINDGEASAYCSFAAFSPESQAQELVALRRLQTAINGLVDAFASVEVKPREEAPE